VPCHTFLLTLQEIAPDHFLPDFYELSEAEYLVLTTRTQQARKENNRLAVITGDGTGGGFCKIHPVHGHRPAAGSCSRVFYASCLPVKVPVRGEESFDILFIL